MAKTVGLTFQPVKKSRKPEEPKKPETEQPSEKKPEAEK